LCRRSCERCSCAADFLYQHRSSWGPQSSPTKLLHPLPLSLSAVPQQTLLLVAGRTIPCSGVASVWRTQGSLPRSLLSGLHCSVRGERARRA